MSISPESEHASLAQRLMVDVSVLNEMKPYVLHIQDLMQRIPKAGNSLVLSPEQRDLNAYLVDLPPKVSKWLFTTPEGGNKSRIVLLRSLVEEEKTRKSHLSGCSSKEPRRRDDGVISLI